MASIRLGGAAGAVVLACLSTTAVAAPPRSPAATLWQLRSGLNVAALSCRSADEAVIVAGYNKLLTDHRGELASAYQAITAEYAGPAAFDDAMTRLYNHFASPAGQGGLCDAARVILDEAGAHPDAPLAALAEPALALIEAAYDAGPAPLPPVAIAAAAIPQILPEPPAEH